MTAAAAGADPSPDNDAKLLSEEAANRTLLEELAVLRGRQRKLTLRAAAVDRVVKPSGGDQ